MSIPDDLKNMLIRHEGLSLKPYKCPAGKETIGFGHNMIANPLPDHIASYLSEHGEITTEMANELLETDIFKASEDCHRLYRDFDKFSDRRRWALIDFMFNVGLTTAKSFYNTNRAINREDWNFAADQMKKSLWARQVGSRSETITEMVRNG